MEVETEGLDYRPVEEEGEVHVVPEHDHLVEEPHEVPEVDPVVGGIIVSLRRY